jgi:hypothetical protein
MAQIVRVRSTIVLAMLTRKKGGPMKDRRLKRKSRKTWRKDEAQAW